MRSATSCCVEHYRTLPDERAYLGYSMGAEFGGFMLLSAPNTFNYYLLGSPSLDTTSLSFLKTLKYEASKQNPINTDVFVSIGELETTRMSPPTNLLSGSKITKRRELV